MLILRIAVCLSAQPRSIEFAKKSIINHFRNGEHQYDFFCHAWNYNTWKLISTKNSSDIEYVDQDWLIEQLSLFNPKKIIIDCENVLKASNKNIDVPYGSLTYSAMKANHLKRMYELENNFRYDYVVKCRYDSVFRENTSIPFPIEICERTIYVPHLGRLSHEYNRLNASDCIYFGDSWGMDIASDLYRFIKIRVPAGRVDNIDTIGPGTIMFEYGTLYNIHFIEYREIQEIFYRKEALGMDVFRDFDKILDLHHQMYRQG